MITKLSIDNYRCFLVLDLPLGPIHLFLGANGSGKSSVFSALHAIKSIIHGESVDSLFSVSDICQRGGGSAHGFSFEMQEGDDCFKYSVTIGYYGKKSQIGIERERLEWNGELFYFYAYGEAHVFHQSDDVLEKQGSVEFDGSRSFLSMIPEQAGNKPIIRFRDAVHRWLFFQINPFAMDPLSMKEQPILARDASNFASWYRHVMTTVPPDRLVKLHESLSEAMPGFRGMTFGPGGPGDARVLQVQFGDNINLNLGQLSDGQRALLVLYTILHTPTKIPCDLFIDEPDNFISLREIQPWLAELQEAVEESDRQAIIISHHPEIINTMAHGQEIWFHRSEAGPVKTGPFPTHGSLTPAETMTRGWDDE